MSVNLSGLRNLEAMFRLADTIDLREGLLSYERYNRVMQELSDLYGFPLYRVTGAFCALSPNNDYHGNLRSLVSLLDGVRKGWSFSEIQCSTYRHCLERAYSYVMGDRNFISEVKGRKIRSFYLNILDPGDTRYVTVDGHICAAFRGKRLTMKEAIVRGAREYDEIEYAVKQLAFREFMRPNQMQAVIWFTRKRVYNIKAELHGDLFLPPDDVWKTYRDVRAIVPFAKRLERSKKDEPLREDKLL